MLNFGENLRQILQEQGVLQEDEDVCFNIVLNNGFVYEKCFLLSESDDDIFIVETDAEGFERARIVFKEHISSVEMLYRDQLFIEEVDDSENERMFL